MFEDIQFICCQGPVDTGYCVCSIKEMALRRYSNSLNTNLRPMTSQEREELIQEADQCGEGFYSYKELNHLSDEELASAVLNSWHMYVQSNCL